jgi:hypothetical protein
VRLRESPSPYLGSKELSYCALRTQLLMSLHDCSQRASSSKPAAGANRAERDFFSRVRLSVGRRGLGFVCCCLLSDYQWQDFVVCRFRHMLIITPKRPAYIIAVDCCNWHHPWLICQAVRFCDCLAVKNDAVIAFVKVRESLPRSGRCYDLVWLLDAALGIMLANTNDAANVLSFCRCVSRSRVRGAATTWCGC